MLLAFAGPCDWEADGISPSSATRREFIESITDDGHSTKSENYSHAFVAGKVSFGMSGFTVWLFRIILRSNLLVLLPSALKRYYSTLVKLI